MFDSYKFLNAGLNTWNGLDPLMELEWFTALPWLCHSHLKALPAPRGFCGEELKILGRSRLFSSTNHFVGCPSCQGGLFHCGHHDFSHWRHQSPLVAAPSDLCLSVSPGFPHIQHDHVQNPSQFCHQRWFTHLPMEVPDVNVQSGFSQWWFLSDTHL